MGQTEPVVGSVRTILWEKGRGGRPVTWELGKLGVLGREAEVVPGIGERWAVRVVKDTAPGERGGVLILYPISPVAEADAPVQQDIVRLDEIAVDNATNVVELAVAAVSPDAIVDVSLEGISVRYRIRHEDPDAPNLPDQFVRALRTVATNMLAAQGARVWLSCGDDSIECPACRTRYHDPVDFGARTTSGGIEERFEGGRPTRYSYRTCDCGKPVYVEEVA